MALSYKNYSKEHILYNARNIRYSNAELVFGFYNNISIELEFKIDVNNLFYQADLFARELMTHRSVIDFKKILGSYQDDWMRILMETYVYDRIKCIYYGINSKYMYTLPDDLISFSGNILLMNALSINQFNFSIDDGQPFNLYLKLKYDNDVSKLFEPIFEFSPDLKEGMSDAEGTYSYVNFMYESVLKGLNNFKSSKFSKGSPKLSSLYFTHKMTDESIKTFLVGDSNPLMNSFFNEDFSKFYYIMPTDKSVPEALRFNESLFISRALGFTGKQLTISDNNMYTVSKVNKDVDRLIREDLYAVTGIKTEIVNYSMEQIKYYLAINTYKKNGGSLKEDLPS